MMDRVSWVPPSPVTWMHLLSLSVGNNNMQLESALIAMQTNNTNVFFPESAATSSSTTTHVCECAAHKN